MKFNHIIKQVIMEQGRYEILKKAYTEPKKKGDTVKPPRIPLEKFKELVKADPTTRSEGDKIKKAGKYVQWIIKQFLNIEPSIEAEYGTDEFYKEKSETIRLFFEDLYKVTEDLTKFDRFKNRLDDKLKDINKLNIDTLYQAVKDFSLEKAKTTKSERKKMDVHPGSKLVYDGDKWQVFEISDKGELGKEAACYYGGNNKETRWCTSGPNLSFFNTYIKDGPLYVLIDKTDENLGDISGLPKHRYQFHFPSAQFMDINDHSINLVKFLNEQPEGLKDFFEPLFAKGLVVNGDTISINPNNPLFERYLQIYGISRLFDKLPKDVTFMEILLRENNPNNKDLNLSKISQFKDLISLHLEGFLTELPENISEIKDLSYLSLPNNPKLKRLPASLAKLKNLVLINIKGTNAEIPEELQKAIEERDITFLD